MRLPPRTVACKHPLLVTRNRVTVGRHASELGPKSRSERAIPDFWFLPACLRISSRLHTTSAFSLPILVCFLLLSTPTTMSDTVQQRKRESLFSVFWDRERHAASFGLTRNSASRKPQLSLSSRTSRPVPLLASRRSSHSTLSVSH